MSDHGLSAVREAMPAFGVEVAAIELLSRSENVVFRVVADDGRCLVARLHRPGYNSPVELESEVAWVSALADSGIPVPRAVPRLDGGHYVAVDVDDGDGTRQLGVIEWVEGSPIGGAQATEDDDPVEHFAWIGSLAARIRLHGAGWQPPEGFTRRRWDADGLVGPAPLWGRFWEVDALSSEQRELFSVARHQLAATLNDLSTGGDRFGLIHADLHLANVMTNGRSLTVIDFDDAGFGWFPFELAVALHPMLDHSSFADARAAIVDGYRRMFPVDDEEIDLIDLFLVVRCLMLVGWLDARRELPLHAQFEAMVDQAERTVRRYLESGRV